MRLPLVFIATVSAADVITYTGGRDAWSWTMNVPTTIPIHNSCNASESNLIQKGFSDVRTLAQVAIDHIHAHGTNSSLVRRLFGSGNLAEAVGWYQGILYANKAGTLFRCDDIDGNCKQPEWYGHWRGSNATLETVICPLTYTGRKPLEHVCMGSDALRNVSASAFTGTDFLHRMFHLPKLNGNDLVSHFADSYDDCVTLAQTKPEEAVRNTHTLQWFSVEAFAFELVVPGVGCSGFQDSISLTDASNVTAQAAAAASGKPNNGCTAHEDHWHCPAGVTEPTSPPGKT
ncbi:putative peptidase family-domain-containing protein [Protomyces lactucae-debilis]|uniref:Putative peptidase family-domain-containing protein n=1 Tax=Protomyces lactucae-debilis TaxID=2754530 RepID=A0A1Y2F3S1_PROLT|nr:putative peptidase family-domain-containing protein [Protomyces lactucae-debilis]ORY78519.1 putative peptidase family-domain-containing protein [Protomyces lactucae-debilis]